MRLIKVRNIILFCSWLFAVTAFAQPTFNVQKIRIDGLQRIPQATVMNYLPIKVGQSFDVANSGKIIRALYDTGFFSNVQLYREDNTLIINVIERPTIGTITFTGNDKIKTKKLLEVLKQAGIEEGLVFDHSSLQGLQQTLEQQYYEMGHYNATVTTAISRLKRNRVAIAITIYEGDKAKIRNISVLGNQVYTEHKLLEQFELAPSSLLTLIIHRDEYSREKLDADIEQLRSFYLDHGYLDVRVDATQVFISPDKNSIYISVHVAEGPQYFVKSVKVNGHFLGQKDTVLKLVTIKAGQVFSRKVIIDNDRNIAQYYANLGYAFANVQAVPTIDRAARTVALKYQVEPGSRVYIRNIHFIGNVKTADYVLRREMRLQEGSAFSWNNIQESKRRLANFHFLKDVAVVSKKVPGHPDQMDLDFNVKDQSSAVASVTGGYSDLYGFLYGANFNEQNFLGTGKQISVGFSHSEYSRYYNFTYTNPYYTLNGISRSFNFYIQQQSPVQLDLAPYQSEHYGLSVDYGIPISEYMNATLGFGYEYMSLYDIQTGAFTPGSQTGDQVIADYVANNGTRFNQTKVDLGLTFSNYDRAIFPTRGINNQLQFEIGLPVFGRNLDYYLLADQLAAYWPVPHLKGFILDFRGSVGWGQGYDNTRQFPFFKNFYAGGMGSVRGYSGNSLDSAPFTRTLAGDAIGGNLLTVASAGLIVPNPLQDKVRTSLFFDIGQVYHNTITVRDLRYSVGVEIDWWSPFGPLQFSLAKALLVKPGDDTRPFDFSIGTSL